MRGMELALDIAFQCSPDHPWVTEHPEWFKKRSDGSIQYAENPPKKYQDIYPINFDTDPERPLTIDPWQEQVLHDLLNAEIYVRLVEAARERGETWSVTWAGEEAASTTSAICAVSERNISWTMSRSRFFRAWFR